MSTEWALVLGVWIVTISSLATLALAFRFLRATEQDRDR